MADHPQPSKNEISVNDLKTGMVITAYTRFSDRYQFIDKPTASFISYNFKNTRAVVDRNGRRLNIPIEHLQTGDSLKKIHSFPPHLQKLTRVVNERFISELKKRGMLGFQVQSKNELDSRSRQDLRDLMKMVEATTDKPAAKTLTVRQQQKHHTVQVAEQLIRQVQIGAELRDNAAKTLESTMDRIRQGGLSIREITGFVKDIVTKGSADGIGALIGLNQGSYVYEHSVDVGALFQLTYFAVIDKKNRRSIFRSKEQALMAAFLHDIGKAKIPKPIIDSTDPFEKNSRNLQIVRSHPVFGADLLSRMNQPDSVVNMARFHHIKQNTDMLTSYPIGIPYQKVNFETRLLSIIDIYQALAGKRRYQKSWSPPATMRYLEALAGIEYDLRVWELFLEMMGTYPKGSLVKLSDGSLGFVMNVPVRKENLERPLVAIIKSGGDETLGHPDLVDLSVERDLRITGDIDSQTVFGDKALDIFTRLSFT